MKLVITFGKKLNPKPYETVHVEITQEYDTDDVPREYAYNEVRNYVLAKLEEELASYVAKEETEEIKPLQRDVPTVESYDHLNWRVYKGYGTAGPDEEAYTFRYQYRTSDPVEEAIPLIAKLDPKGEKWTQIGKWEYRLGGDNLVLINRRKPKTKE